MPYQPKDVSGGLAPKTGHLGILTSSDGEVLAVPPGAIVYVIEDSTDPSKMFPMGVVKINRQAMKFKCLCHDPNCTKTYTYKLVGAAGRHESEQQRTQAHVKKQLTK